jgi:hypothetical protein
VSEPEAVKGTGCRYVLDLQFEPITSETDNDPAVQLFLNDGSRQPIKFRLIWLSPLVVDSVTADGKEFRILRRPGADGRVQLQVDPPDAFRVAPSSFEEREALVAQIIPLHPQAASLIVTYEGSEAPVRLVAPIVEMGASE